MGPEKPHGIHKESGDILPITGELPQICAHCAFIRLISETKPRKINIFMKKINSTLNLPIILVISLLICCLQI